MKSLHDIRGENRAARKRWARAMRRGDPTAGAALDRYFETTAAVLRHFVGVEWCAQRPGKWAR